MNEANTPKIGSTLLENDLEYIPEAHCYLKRSHQRAALTTAQSDIDNLAADIIEKIEMEPEQANHFKIDFHKRYLKNWIIENHIHLDFDEVWEIRERCIKNSKVKDLCCAHLSRTERRLDRRQLPRKHPNACVGPASRRGDEL